MLVAVTLYCQITCSLHLQVEDIDVSSIPPSTLTNSGLLMAVFVADGEEVASVNMVVNVAEDESGAIIREVYNPLA